MESQKIMYITPDEIRGLDFTQISSMQMKSGDAFLISENIGLQHEEKDKGNNEPSSEIKLRARKEVKDEEEKQEEKAEEKKEEEKPEEKPEEKDEEKIEIEIEGQPNEGEEKKEILRGPDGKPLLSEMLIYGGLDYGTVQEQANNENVNLYPVPQNYEPVVQPNMPGTKNTENQPQPQPQPQTNIDLNKNENQTQNYSPQEINNQGYQSADINTQKEENPFEGQNEYNQNIPQPQQEIIPTPDINIPQQNEPYPKYEPNMEQQQNINYPEFEEQNNNIMPQPEIPTEQPPEYQPPYQPPVEPIIPPSQQPEYQPPQYDYNQPQVQPPMQPQEERPPIQPHMQPPMQPPVQPQMYPPKQPQMYPPKQPQMYPPRQPQMYPPKQPQVYPPRQPQVYPPRQPQMYPPRQPPLQPPMYNPPMQNYYPGRKKILPKKPVVQINIGMQQPMPYGYTVPHMMPVGPRRLVPQRRNVNPVGEIIDFVADPIGFMVEKSLGLRSNKPKTEKKEGENETKKEEEIKEEKNEKANEEVNEPQKEVVLRARKMEVEEKEEPEYEEVEYNGEEQDQIQQEVICPECAGENLCPECTGETICPECKGEVICPECKGETLCPGCNNKLKNKIYKTGQFNNFNFHEIVATSDNTKSHVVVKKGGITISDN